MDDNKNKANTIEIITNHDYKYFSSGVFDSIDYYGKRTRFPIQEINMKTEEIIKRRKNQQKIVEDRTLIKMIETYKGIIRETIDVIATMLLERGRAGEEYYESYDLKIKPLTIIYNDGITAKQWSRIKAYVQTPTKTNYNSKYLQAERTDYTLKAYFFWKKSDLSRIIKDNLIFTQQITSILNETKKSNNTQK